MTVTIYRPRTLTDAADHAATYKPGTPERYYWNGVVLAFLAERGTFTTEYTDLVNSDWLAQPVTDGQAINLATLAGLTQDENRENHPGRLPRFLNTCGALWGHKEATAHRPDADECAACDRRILTATEDGWVTCCNHGIVHEQCAEVLCGRSCDTWPQP